MNVLSQMTMPDVALSIQTLLSPVIMISACGLLLLGMLNRYGRINDRLRELGRERMSLFSQKGEKVADTHLEGIDNQIPDLLMRNSLLKNAVLCLFLSVIAFVLVIFSIALGMFMASHVGVVMAFCTFLMGEVFVFIGMIFMAREIQVSNNAVSYEIHQIMKL